MNLNELWGKRVAIFERDNNFDKPMREKKEKRERERETEREKERKSN
jgi:hypothetical protein